MNLTESPLRRLWREVFDAADRALEMDQDEQQTFLRQCLEEHPAVGAELKAMIDNAAAASTLETPASVFAAAFLQGTADDQPAAEDGNTDGEMPMFGPYRVRRELGSGGMGAVYLAERSDDQYRKEVALKVLPQWGGGSRNRFRRFLEERQILATLNHPGIARLLDGGVTADGLPWFAMEYIDGEHIDRYCDARLLSVEDRLRLFCDVCSAVQYAHRNLVVHRDLKPSNILVAPDGRVALLDFGISRLLADENTMEAQAKMTVDRLLTPLYSSPEQIRGEPASTAADVYALGVLLHLLLTGSNPYRLSSFESFEVAHAVLEHEPERPSVSAARGGTSAKLARRLRGDLDAIVLKAISKDPARRYATVEQLQTDVQRHLSGFPVLAQPDSRSYVARKFMARHRTGVALATAAAVLVIGFAAVMTVQRSRIRAQAERIALERDRAEASSQNFAAIFRSVAPGDHGVTAREILDSATASINDRLISYPEQRAPLMFEMARAYHRLELNDRAHNLLQLSLGLRRNLQPRPDAAIAETLNLLGEVLLAQGSISAADSAYNEALVLRRRQLGTRHRDVARTLVGLSAVRRAQHRLPEAEVLARQAVVIDQSRGHEGRADLARSTSAFAAVVSDEGNPRAAVVQLRNALALIRATHPEEDSELSATIFDLAAALHAAGEHRTADSLTRYGLGLNRRLLTSAILNGTVGSQRSTDTPQDVNETVRRAFAEKPVTSGSTSPAVNADASLIAFISDRDGPDPIGNLGNHEIYVMNPDGTNQRRLTHEKAIDETPVISPDGSRIAFHSERAGGSDIFLMNADGSDQHQLTHFGQRGLSAAEPAWSPDGKRIVFHSRVNSVGLYVINVDGTGLTRILDGPGSFPVWSPDGRRIAFTSRRDGRGEVPGGYQEIYVMNADGSNVVRLTFNKAGDSNPAWSPDGSRIAFQSDRDGNPDIYVMNADGSNVVRLTSNPAKDGHPWWSPDGRRIVFHRRLLGHGQIHVMNADGSNVKRLTDLSAVAFNSYPSWGRAHR